MKRKCDISSRALLWARGFARLSQPGAEEACHDLMLLGRHRARARDERLFFPRENGGAQLRVEIVFAIGELFLQMAGRKFHGHKLMMIRA